MTPAIKAAEKAKIVFDVHQYEHDPNTAAYGEEAAKALGVTAERVFKTLVVSDSKALAVAIVPVASRLNLKACASALKTKRVNMAEPRDAERVTGYVVGGISPLGQKQRLRTVLDESALTFSTVFVSAGRRGLEIELAPGDLSKLTTATVSSVAQ
jgi:Cys-tRNA(Pro)/Cys-tRNA(Cys) deacylase